MLAVSADMRFADTGPFGTGGGYLGWRVPDRRLAASEPLECAMETINEAPPGHRRGTLGQGGSLYAKMHLKLIPVQLFPMLGFAASYRRNVQEKSGVRLAGNRSCQRPNWDSSPERAGYT